MGEQGSDEQRGNNGKVGGMVEMLNRADNLMRRIVG